MEQPVQVKEPLTQLTQVILYFKFSGDGELFDGAEDLNILGDDQVEFSEII